MSIPSYRRNVSLGVTGQYTDTCYLAALEQVSPGNRLQPDTYVVYQRFLKKWNSLSGQDTRKANPMFKTMLERIAWELGELTFDDIEFERPQTYGQLRNIVGKLIRRDYRVAVDLRIDGYPKDYAHPVGLIPTGDGETYKLVSNWVPKCLHGYVTLREVYEHLDMQPEEYRQRYPFNDTNLTALPPAET